MRLSSLANLIDGTQPAEHFSAEIAGELLHHSQGLESQRGSAAVLVIPDAEIVLDSAGLGKLCQLFVSGQLSASELAYVADSLQLSDHVQIVGSSTADHLAECTDPAINGALTVNRALEIAQLI